MWTHSCPQRGRAEARAPAGSTDPWVPSAGPSPLAPAVPPPSGCFPPVPQVHLSGRPGSPSRDPPEPQLPPHADGHPDAPQNARLNLGDTRSHCGPRTTSSWAPCTCSHPPHTNCQTEQSPHTVLGTRTQCEKNGHLGRKMGKKLRAAIHKRRSNDHRAWKTHSRM